MPQKNQNKSKPKLLPSTGLETEKLPTQVFNPLTDITPLSNFDGEKLQEMVNLNNTFSALKKQQQQYDAAIFMLNKKREQINNGQISLPVMVQITRTLSHAESDKAKVLKHIDDELYNIKMARQGIIGSLEHRRDEYVECVLRVKKMLDEKVKNYEIKQVSGIRGTKSVEEDEKKAMENELEKVLKERV